MRSDPYEEILEQVEHYVAILRGQKEELDAVRDRLSRDALEKMAARAQVVVTVALDWQTPLWRVAAALERLTALNDEALRRFRS